MVLRYNFGSDSLMSALSEIGFICVSEHVREDDIYATTRTVPTLYSAQRLSHISATF